MLDTAELDLTLDLGSLEYDQGNASCISFTPNDKQYAYMVSKARQKILLGGNRSGKTITTCVDVALTCLGIKGFFYPGFPKDGVGVDAWVVGLDTAKWKDALIPNLRQALGPFLKRYKYEGIFELTNGRTITLKTMESGFTKFQSANCPLILFDEYPPMDIYKECVMRTAQTGGVVMVAATPTRGTSWITDEKYDAWFKGTQGRLVDHEGVIFVSLHTEDNKHISPGAVLDIEREYKDPAEREARLHGKPFVPGGLVFAPFDYTKHVVKPFALPDHFILCRGFDWGIMSPGTCLWMAFDPNEKVFYAYREYYKKEMSVPVICKEVLEMSGKERYLYNLLDPSAWARTHGDEQGGWFNHAQEYIQNGIPVTKGNNPREQGIDRVNFLLKQEKPRLYIFENCVNLIAEISKYPWSAVVNSKGQIVQGTSGKPDHLLDPLRYILMAFPDVEDYTEQQVFVPKNPTPQDFNRTMEQVAVEHPDGTITFKVVRKTTFDPTDY